jgi:polysaccharide export outer membrane protein
METRVRPLTGFRITLLALLVGSAGAIECVAQEHGAAAADRTESKAAAPPEYVIGPADVLQLTVWKEPDLTRLVTVRRDGMVTIPLVGDVSASGRTPSQLAEAIGNDLKKFIEVPRVTVGIEQANSARFYVVGQVAKSGEFALSGPTSVLQALALAGGFKDFAKTDGIVIVRRDRSVVPVNYKRIADGSNVAQNAMLLPGDTIVVP